MTVSYQHICLDKYKAVIKFAMILNSLIEDVKE